MDNRPFSIGDAFRHGWQLTIAHWQPMLLLGVAGAILGLLQRVLNEHPSGLSSLLSIALYVVLTGLSMVWIRTALRVHDGQGPDLEHWKDVLPRFGIFLLTSVLLSLLVSIGLVLLIVPGVLAALAYGFAPFVVVDKPVEVFDAFRESSRLTRGVKGPLFLFALALLCANFLGALVFGLGLFISIPLSYLATAEVFRRLQERVGEPVPTSRAATTFTESRV